MFGGFDFEQLFGEVRDAEIQVYVGTQLTQSNKIQAPIMALKQQYIQLLQQIIDNKQQPMSVKMIVKQDIYDDNNKFIRTLYNSIECSNYTKEYEEGL